MKTKLIAFVIYTILFETLIWGGTGYAVFWMGHSGWWMLAAAVVSSAQLKGKHFGISEGE